MVVLCSFRSSKTKMATAALRLVATVGSQHSNGRLWPVPVSQRGVSRTDTGNTQRQLSGTEREYVLSATSGHMDAVPQSRHGPMCSCRAY